MQGKFYDKQKEEMIRTLIYTVQCSGMIWNLTKIKSGWQSIISGQTKYWLWTWIALDQTVNTCLWALMTIMMGNDDTGCPKKSTGCPKKIQGVPKKIQGVPKKGTNRMLLEPRRRCSITSSRHPCLEFVFLVVFNFYLAGSSTSKSFPWATALNFG